MEGEEVRSLSIQGFGKVTCIDIEIVSGLHKVIRMVLERVTGCQVSISSRNMAGVIQESVNTCSQTI